MFIAWLLFGALVGYAASQRRGFSTAAGIIGGMLMGILSPLMFFASGDLQKCPSCAEWIKREATVCRHCKTALDATGIQYAIGTSAAQPRRARAAVLTVLVAAVALSMVGITLIYFTGPKTTLPALPSLDVTAGKGALGIDITNREGTTLTNCIIAALERGRPDEWYASILRFRHMETVSLRWAEFRGRDGASMPAYVGQNARHFTIRCVDNASASRGAGFAF